MVSIENTIRECDSWWYSTNDDSQSYDIARRSREISLYLECCSGCRVVLKPKTYWMIWRLHQIYKQILIKIYTFNNCLFILNFNKNLSNVTKIVFRYLHIYIIFICSINKNIFNLYSNLHLQSTLLEMEIRNIIFFCLLGLIRNVAFDVCTMLLGCGKRN